MKKNLQLNQTVFLIRLDSEFKFFFDINPFATKTKKRFRFRLWARKSLQIKNEL